MFGAPAGGGMYPDDHTRSSIATSPNLQNVYFIIRGQGPRGGGTVIALALALALALEKRVNAFSHTMTVDCTVHCTQNEQKKQTKPT